MNKRNKVVAVITSILLAASMASLSIPAQAEQNTDVAPMSCPEIGHHQSSLTKAAYSWQVLYLKIGFRLVGHTL